MRLISRVIMGLVSSVISRLVSSVIIWSVSWKIIYRENTWIRENFTREEYYEGNYYGGENTLKEIIFIWKNIFWSYEEQFPEAGNTLHRKYSIDRDITLKEKDIEREQISTSVKHSGRKVIF